MPLRGPAGSLTWPPWSLSRHLEPPLGEVSSSALVLFLCVCSGEGLVAGVDLVLGGRHQEVASRCRHRLDFGRTRPLIAVVLLPGLGDVVGVIAQGAGKKPSAGQSQAGAAA